MKMFTINETFVFRKETKLRKLNGIMRKSYFCVSRWCPGKYRLRAWIMRNMLRCAVEKKKTDDETCHTWIYVYRNVRGTHTFRFEAVGHRDRPNVLARSRVCLSSDPKENEGEREWEKKSEVKFTNIESSQQSQVSLWWREFNKLDDRNKKKNDKFHF